MNNNHQSLIAAVSAFQSSLEKMNTDLTTAYSPIIQSVSQMQSALAYAMYPQISLANQIQAMHEALLAPIQEMQISMNRVISNDIANALALNNSAIQDLTKNIQNSLVDFSSHISTDFSSILKNISFHQEYVEVPEYLYSFTIHGNEYPQEVPLTAEAPIPKRRMTLEFFLSCVLPNIIALFSVWLTIYYHNVDTSSQSTTVQAELAMFESYTESLNQLNTSVSALNDYLVSQSKLYPDSCSGVATDSNAVREVNESDSATAGVSGNLDMLQQPD
ncbi:hypothetical protein [Enterocloster bolteae]|uniref:hypothetical protein n=1 Tax=Enterocloster bolteae TaxID=208479 RepID=UPI00210E4D26|nr:hypothetical protein [Enterocloster bolteae]MCQ4758380.1 hypothetical protein [Enterocloster bolteae]